ncbi:MAG: EamA family transporter [Flavobacterium sp.]
MKNPKHYLAAVTAFTIWGFMSLGLKPIQAYPSLDILFYRVFLCIILILIINLGFRRQVIKTDLATIKAMPKPQRRKLLAAIIVSGLLLTSNWYLFIYVMNHVSVKTASFAYLVCPIITTIFAFIFLKEKLTGIQWFAVLVSVAGCVLLSLNNYMDLFYSLVVASTYALYLIIQKKITSLDKFLVLTAQMLITAVVILPFYPTMSGPLPQNPVFYMYIGIIAVMFTIIPLFLNLFALKKIKSSTVGILIYINPIIGFMLAALYYGEDVTALQIISYALIIISILVFNSALFTKKVKA